MTTVDNDNPPAFLAVTQQVDLQRRLREESRQLADGANDLPSLRKLALGEGGDLESRWRAAIALGKLHDLAAVSNLIDLTNDVAWEMRHSAVWSLCLLADAAALDRLIAICSSGKLDEQINYIAAMGLAAQFGEQGKRILEANLQHADASVRAWARCSLANVSYR